MWCVSAHVYSIFQYTYLQIPIARNHAIVKSTTKYGQIWFRGRKKKESARLWLNLPAASPLLKTLSNATPASYIYQPMLHFTAISLFNLLSPWFISNWWNICSEWNYVPVFAKSAGVYFPVNLFGNYSKNLGNYSKNVWNYDMVKKWNNNSHKSSVIKN